MKIQTIILTIVTAVAVNSTAFAADDKKPQQCNTYCNSVNMDGSGGQICQTVCE